MNRKFGAIFLIAGTCLGSGMLALPIVLSKIGLLYSLIFMVSMWAVMYVGALITVELNLQAKKSMPLGLLGQHFSGPIAKNIGTLSLKILSYALLPAFLYGATSIIHECLPSFGKQTILMALGGLAYVILICQASKIDLFNRLLFFALLGGLLFLITLLLCKVEWHVLPLLPSVFPSSMTWGTLLPVVFTSFGFHGMIHTITAYCQNDKTTLKKAFFWGSLIPALLYIVWTWGVLGAVYGNDASFYTQLSQNKVEVGALVRALATLTEKPFIKTLIWSGMILKFMLSIIGVGISLRDALSPLFPEKSIYRQKWLLGILTMLPPVLIASIVPNAFITILGFAGMILSVIAIVLPIYLLQFIPSDKLHYKILTQPVIKYTILGVGLCVIGFELFSLLH